MTLSDIVRGMILGSYLTCRNMLTVSSFLCHISFACSLLVPAWQCLHTHILDHTAAPWGYAHTCPPLACTFTWFKPDRACVGHSWKENATPWLSKFESVVCCTEGRVGCHSSRRSGWSDPEHAEEGGYGHFKARVTHPVLTEYGWYGWYSIQARKGNMNRKKIL